MFLVIKFRKHFEIILLFEKFNQKLKNEFKTTKFIFNSKILKFCTEAIQQS